MKLHPVLFPDFCRFAQKQLLTGDIDPSYPVLRRAYAQSGLTGNDALWRTLLYVSWYNITSAVIAAEWVPEFHYGLGLPNLATGIERRGFRARPKLIANMLDAVFSRSDGDLDGWIRSRLRGTPEESWVSVGEAFRTIPGNGTWAAYKWCDLLTHVHSYPLSANSIGEGGGGETAGPVPGMVQLTGLDWRVCATDLGAQHELLSAARSEGVSFSGLDQLETALCDFNSLTKGRYYVGHDIDSQLKDFAKLPPMPLSDALRAARLESFPPEHLGEVGGWTGVRPWLKDSYRSLGVI